MRHLVTNDITTTHVARMKFYADSELDTNISALLDDIQYETDAFNMYNVQSITDYKYDNDRMEYLIHVKWEGFSDLENTWESFIASIVRYQPILQDMFIVHPVLFIGFSIKFNK